MGEELKEAMQAPKWISAKEQIPKPYEHVLTRVEYEDSMGFAVRVEDDMRGGKKFCEEWMSERDAAPTSTHRTITHWMPSNWLLESQP